MAAVLLVLLVPYLAWLAWAALRHPVPLRYNWRSLWQRRTSTLSTAGAIAVVVAIFVVVRSLDEGLSTAFISSGRADQAIVLRPNSRVEMSSTLERDQVRILKSSPLVAVDAGGPLVSAECVVVRSLDRADGDGTSNVSVRGLEPAGIRMRDQVRLVQGRWFKPGLNEMVVPRSLQRRFAGLGLGQAQSFGGRQWEVVGVFDAGGSAFDSEVWVDVTSLMQAYRRLMYSSVLVRLPSPAQVAGFALMADEDKRLKLETKAETAYYAEQTESGQPIRVLGNLITLILTVGAVFAAMNTMYSSVASRTQEIGTLRALGFRRREILTSFQWEALMLCTLGGLAGVLLSLGFNGIQTGATNFSTFSDVGFAFLITPRLMAQGMGFSLVMGLLGGFLPAYRASRIPLTEAMKGG
jgi:putative ABC transport system permease protein